MKTTRFFSVSMLLCAALMVALCATYLAKVASPWPLGDMWDGQVAFLVEQSDDLAYSGFFAQHNEHRIAITRGLFFLDEQFFGGTNASLYVWHFVFALVFCLLFARVIWAEVRPQARLVLLSFCAIVSFSLAQAENFGWAFQGQFFLAYVLPFAAYVAWAQFRSSGRVKWAIATLALGGLSALTMANGALALVPLIVFEALGRTRLKWVLVFTLVQALVLALYLWDYSSISGHSSASGVISKPWLWAGFTLVFVGAWAGTAGLLVGGLITGGATHWLWWHARRVEAPRLSHALLLLIMFVVMTAAITALGRAESGLGSASSGRYATPALYALAAALGLAYIRATWRPRWLHLAMGFVAVVALVDQFGVTRSSNQREFLKRAATLSVIQEVPDADMFTAHAYPWNVQEQTVTAALEAGIGVFGQAPYSQMRGLIGQALPASAQALGVCEGGLAAVVPLDGGGARLVGWINEPSVDRGFAPLVVSQAGSILGFGLNGSWKSAPDAPAQWPAQQRFWAYVGAGVDAEATVAVQFFEGGGCALTLSLDP